MILQANNPTKVVAEPGRQGLTIIREFEAPRELVFQAYTDPELYAQWLGPRTLRMELEKFEPRSGGSWRYIHRDKEGRTYAFHGVYHEIRPPEKLISTFEFEGLPEPGHVSLQEASFEELPGKRTRVVSHVVYLSVTDRDGELKSGMETGLSESYLRLDELLAVLRRGSPMC